eukprot:2946375-Rhodomonas_salina.1
MKHREPRPSETAPTPHASSLKRETTSAAQVTHRHVSMARMRTAGRRVSVNDAIWLHNQPRQLSPSDIRMEQRSVATEEKRTVS